MAGALHRQQQRQRSPCRQSRDHLTRRRGITGIRRLQHPAGDDPKKVKGWPDLRGRLVLYVCAPQPWLMGCRRGAQSLGEGDLCE